MTQLLQSPYFGLALTIFAYLLGIQLQRKFKSPLCNAMVVAVAFVILVLSVFGITYDDYYVGASFIYYMLGPATACLGVSIYNKLDVLKANLLPVLVGCITGTLTSVISVAVLCKVFGLEHALTMSLLPKSVTTAIAVPISQANGGIMGITSMAVAITGIAGNVFAPLLAKTFRIKNPVAEGIAIGTASHGMGTAKAVEIGDVQGAMSGLAMGLCGIFTAFVALSFPYLF